MADARVIQRDDGFFTELIHRHDVELDGTKDGVNKVFTIPGGEKAHNDALHKLEVEYNGFDMTEGVGCDYLASESGGPGTGYDTVTFVFAPDAQDTVVAHFDRVD